MAEDATTDAAATTHTDATTDASITDSSDATLAEIKALADDLGITPEIRHQFEGAAAERLVSEYRALLGSAAVEAHDEAANRVASAAG